MKKVIEEKMLTLNLYSIFMGKTSEISASLRKKQSILQSSETSQINSLLNSAMLTFTIYCKDTMKFYPNRNNFIYLKKINTGIYKPLLKKCTSN